MTTTEEMALARKIAADRPGVNALQKCAFLDGKWDDSPAVQCALAGIIQTKGLGAKLLDMKRCFTSAHYLRNFDHLKGIPMANEPTDRLEREAMFNSGTIYEALAKSLRAKGFQQMELTLRDDGGFDVVQRKTARLHASAARKALDTEGAANADVPMTNAARDVLAERQRQIVQEGWTPEHDDNHSTGEMAAAAAAYAFSAATSERYLHLDPIGLFPWGAEWWKPKTPREDLVRAGALILAEIERIDRMEGAANG